MTTEMQAQAEDRRLRAVREINSYRFKRTGKNQVKVTSASGREYSVTTLNGSTVCNCPDFMNRCVGTELRCKHIQAVGLWEEMNKSIDRSMNER